MDSSDTFLILLALLFCLLHGWFSAAIIAVRTLGSQLRTLQETNPQFEYYQKRKATLRCTVSVEMIAGTAVVAVCLYLAAANGCLLLENLALLWWTLPGIVALLAMQIADGAARGIGRKYAEKTAARSLGYVKAVVALLRPLRMLYAGVNRLMGGNRLAKEQVTEEEIMQLINVGNENGVIETQQYEMIHNIFAFDDIPISEVMTHRKELVAVDVEMEIQDVVDLARDENYSRMPVYQESIDNVIGVLNTKDLLGLIGCRDISGFHVQHFLREALFVPETAKCDDVLSEMSRKKMQMAIVVDEYGGTAGVVCMEDILEEIVGNIQDEYDDEEQEIRRVTDTLFTIDGHADPEDVLPLLGRKLPEKNEYDTMSGFVVNLLGRIPEAHEDPSVEWEAVRFTVMRMEDNWIAKIKAEILPPEVPEMEK